MQVGDAFVPYRRFQGVVVPDGLLRCQELSPGAKLAWGRLARFAGKDGRCFPSIRKLAVELGTSPRHARRYVAELEEHSLIRREQQVGSVNRYEFLWHGVFATETPRTDPSAPPRTDPSALDGQECPTTSDGSVRQREEVKVVVNENQVKESQTPPEPIENPHSDNDPQTRYASPKSELIAVMTKTLGKRPDRKLVRTIEETVELHGSSLSDYVEDIRPRLARLRLPAGPGFYLNHARHWGGEEQHPAAEPKIADPSTDPGYVCLKCGSRKRGEGLSLRDRQLVPCECASAEYISRMVELGKLSAPQAADPASGSAAR
jgi:hypothetical protein